MIEAKINKPAPLLPEEIIARANKLGAALLADGMKGLGVQNDGAMRREINPITMEMRVVGTAFTLETEDGDNLPIHLAMKLLKDGYVMVIDGKGYTGTAYFGDLIARQARAMGAGGIIVDGCVRDRDEIAEMGYPVYSIGYMQKGPGKKNPGRVNCPITCGGVVVNPGDLVVADADGVTVVPKDKLEEALAAAEKKNAYEFDRRDLIDKYIEAKKNNGELFNLSPGWVDEQLKDLGIEL